MSDILTTWQEMNDAETSLDELTRVPPTAQPFSAYERRERLEAWIRTRKINFGYTSHAKEIAVQIGKTDVVFTERLADFPSEHLIAQIALAIEAGVR